MYVFVLIFAMHECATDRRDKQQKQQGRLSDDAICSCHGDQQGLGLLGTLLNIKVPLHVDTHICISSFPACTYMPILLCLACLITSSYKEIFTHIHRCILTNTPLLQHTHTHKT